MNRFICITGVSSGLGQDSAEHLARRGYRIIGTVRSDEDKERLQELLGNNAHIVKIDVTDQEDIKKLAAEVRDICGDHGLFALINNAGIVESGPLMYLEKDALLYQLKVNVNGVHRVTQVLFPCLRQYGDSRVINISSVSGMISFPFTGAYATSKFALEAYSDALRRELAPFGIKVTVIQPAAAKTRIWSKNISVMEEFSHTPYHHILKASGKIFKRSEEKGMEPEVISRTILKALETNNPRTRYLIAPRPWMFRALANLLPDQWVDKILRKKLFEKDGQSLMDFTKGN